ncbi:isocitrate lyase/PEP mutase family protein [Amphritea balenae]|uniref:Oxaloacetate decarboxylase n=1 Tax=Amphritea balenae TaxID=452629 RepID=A0A3P1SXA9_9GAMM|nr:isocitrate lyase/phosphoenolpyruvate mutase family protein [Amphritea balenae]RRD01688.1 oxaloacetate decarboxylase [Amphritea balenae]GGK54990.1 oxaloacetate decarboxylase [Amphritea balenae]
MTTISRQRMRDLLDREQCITCASVFDPLSSRMAEEIGFQAGILGGSVASLMALGMPDIYLLTLNELAAQAKRVCQASDLPVIVDGDSGYGNSLNVMRTVEELEHAGAAMVTIEDTIIPKLYKQPEMNLSSVEEGCSKLNAALQARRDPALSIFARTHAQQPLEQMLERVKAYSRLGVDGICIFGLTEREKLVELSGSTDLPIMLISYGETQLGSKRQLAEQQVRIQFAGHAAYEEAVQAVYQSLSELYAGETSTNPLPEARDLISRFSENAKYHEMTADCFL